MLQVHFDILKKVYVIIRLSKVDLSTTYRITGVATQGRWNVAQWVTSFKVACSIDGITFDIVQDALNQPVADKVGVNVFSSDRKG